VSHGRKHRAAREVLGPVGVGAVGQQARGGGVGEGHLGGVGVVRGVPTRVLGVVPCDLRHTGRESFYLGLVRSSEHRHVGSAGSDWWRRAG